MDTMTNDHDKLIEIGVLLQGVKEKLDAFVIAMSLKADKEDLVKLSETVKSHELWINQQKTQIDDRKEFSAKHLTFLGFMITVCSSLVCGLVVTIISRFLH